MGPWQIYRLPWKKVITDHYPIEADWWVRVKVILQCSLEGQCLLVSSVLEKKEKGNYHTDRKDLSFSSLYLKNHYLSWKPALPPKKTPPQPNNQNKTPKPAAHQKKNTQQNPPENPSWNCRSSTAELNLDAQNCKQGCKYHANNTGTKPGDCCSLRSQWAVALAMDTSHLQFTYGETSPAPNQTNKSHRHLLNQICPFTYLFLFSSWWKGDGFVNSYGWTDLKLGNIWPGKTLQYWHGLKQE